MSTKLKRELKQFSIGLKIVKFHYLRESNNVLMFILESYKHLIRFWKIMSYFPKYQIRNCEN